MFKSKSASKPAQKSIAFSPQNLKMMDDLMKKMGWLSYGEVVRTAVVNLYREHFKAYNDEKAAGKMKLKKLEKLEEQDAIDPEQFATDKKMLVVTNKADGVNFVIYHGWANFLAAVPLDKVKDFFSEHPQELANHFADLDRLGSVKVPSDDYMKGVLAKEYGLVL